MGERDAWVLILGSVPISAGLGIMPGLVLFSFHAFVVLWATSILADVIFVVGTIVVSAAIYFAARRSFDSEPGLEIGRRKMIAAIAGAMLAHLALYVIAWTLVFGRMNSASSAWEYVQAVPEAIPGAALFGCLGWTLTGLLNVSAAADAVRKARSAPVKAEIDGAGKNT